MRWTGPTELRVQVQKLWDRGLVLAAMAGGESPFPRRLILKGPGAAELAERFAEVRRWIAQLEKGAGYYRLEWRQVNHRLLGPNRLPSEAWVDSLDDALAIIGKRREANRFAELVTLTRERRPELLPWLVRRPLQALALAGEWPRLLDIVVWLRHHPRPGMYLRQVDIPGVHTKLIERHRAVLSELLDLALPPECVDTEHSGVSGFCRRYEFRDKPPRIRFRLLDPSLALLPPGLEQDITITADAFERLELPLRRVFITENEINFLAFPDVPRSMVIFGAGYGFETLGRAPWLHSCEVYYWGDLDTHGFAILDQLRAHVPSARSLLMDRATLEAHRALWGSEPRPETRELRRLTDDESALYDDLRLDRLGSRVRLEQERIGFGWLERALGLLGTVE